MAYTTTPSVDYSQTAYDRLAYFAFRPEVYWDRAVEVKPTRQAMPGSTVIFTIQNDLPIAATAINESTDVTPVALSDSTVSVVLAEYGNVVVTTAKLRGTAFVEIDPIVANVVGYNAGVSIDSIAKVPFQTGTNVDYSKGTGSTVTTRATVAATNTFRAVDVRLEKARLRRANVPTFNGSYIAYIHPDVSYDLMGETGTASWTDPHTYSQPDEIWQGEVGMFQGVRFIETPRTPFFPNAGATAAESGTVTSVTTVSGSSTVTVASGGFPGVNVGFAVTGTGIPGSTTVVSITGNSLVLSANATASGTITMSYTSTNSVYGTVFLGRQAVAKAHSIVDGNGENPHVVPGPVTDYLRRFLPLGWYHLVGYSIFRQAALRRVESSSSIDDGGEAAIDQ